MIGGIRVRGKWLLAAAIAATCLTALAFSYCLIRGRMVRAEFSRRARLLTEEFSSTRPQVEAGDNAAPLYLQALNLITAGSDIDSIIDEGRENPEAFLGERAGEVLAPNREALDALARAAAKPGCVLPLEDTVDLFSGTDGRTLDASRLLMIAGLHASGAGRADEAVRFFKTHLQLAAVSESGGTPRDRLKADSILRPAVYNVVRAVELSDTVAARAPELLRAIDAARRRRVLLAKVLRNEKMLALITVNKLLGPDRAGNPASSLWVLSGGYVQASRDCELAVDRCSARSGESYLQALEEIEPLKEAAAEDASNAGVVRRLFFDMAYYCVQSDGVTEASVDSCRLVIGCRLYRLRFGSYPERLEMLVEKFPEHFSEIPPDPFTGKTLRYRKTTSGCVVWSFGPDRVDNGGDWHKDIAPELKK